MQPESKPLMDWLDGLDRVAPCPVELLPEEARGQLLRMMGPADNYVVIPQKWLGPAYSEDVVLIYGRGGMHEALIGLTRSEVAAWFEAA